MLYSYSIDLPYGEIGVVVEADNLKEAAVSIQIALDIEQSPCNYSVDPDKIEEIQKGDYFYMYWEE